MAARKRWKTSKMSTGGLGAGTASLEMLKRLKLRTMRKKGKRRWIGECFQLMHLL